MYFQDATTPFFSPKHSLKKTKLKTFLVCPRRSKDPADGIVHGNSVLKLDLLS